MYKKYPGMTIQQILTIKDIDHMSFKSVNKHVARLGAILRYCVDEGILTSNPAYGLKVSEKKRADEERCTYSKADIEKIIKSLPRDIATPERYWIPLIGLYSGMRLNEICQLYLSDIIKFDGIWCFSINGEKDKRLKNLASERIIPVHPTLLELGLLTYVESVKVINSPRLWMNLTWMDIHGYSNGFGKWYQRFNRTYVTNDSKKVFHSMRHTVADTLKQAGVPEVVISELIGHAHNSITSGRYGKRYQPKVLLEALVHLDYGIEIPLVNVL
jgi:integrase